MLLEAPAHDQVKYQQAKVTRPLDDSDYEPPPPPISNGFFAWFSPVIHLKEEQMIQNIGEYPFIIWAVGPVYQLLTSRSRCCDFPPIPADAANYIHRHL